MPELKPCPFCGGEARIIVSHPAGAYPSYYVACSNIKDCGAKFEWYDTEAEVVAAWNRREGASMNEWISVEDRLPSPGERVIAAWFPMTGEAYLSQSGKWCRSGYIMDTVYTITHWMPLPEPPRKEG